MKSRKLLTHNSLLVCPINFDWFVVSTLVLKTQDFSPDPSGSLVAHEGNPQDRANSLRT